MQSEGKKSVPGSLDPMEVMRIAARFAETGEHPSVQPADIPEDAFQTVHENPSLVRESFWKLLSLPKRHLGIRWLHENDLLGEILPCWPGNQTRCQFRLKALENVHRELWKTGLTDNVFRGICDLHDQVIDGRLNRWAWTALATLLAGGDTENQLSWQKMVRRDLYHLGATEAEIVWVESIITNINMGIKYLRGDVTEALVTPQIVVAALSTIHAVTPPLENSLLENIIHKANQALTQWKNPLDEKTLMDRSIESN